jgi:flagellar hook assembly protein FlgD
VFALEAPGVKRVRIYNLSGALIREMPIGTESGRVAMHWNGRNDAGTKMPSGEYFVRVQAGANFQVRRFSLIR